MLDIVIYLDYNVTMLVKGASLNEYGDFYNYSYNDTKIMNGGILLENIATLLKQSDTFELKIDNNKITIETFSCSCGETCTNIFFIEEVKQNDNE